MKDERLSRREFIGVSGIAAGGLVLAACRNAPSEEVPTSFPPTEAPKPTSTLRPTETPQPSFTPTPTEFREVERGAPGDILLYPEVVLNRVVEMKRPARAEFMDYFYNTIVKTNPEYFESLTLSDGRNVTDAETFWIYSLENGWMYDGNQIYTPRHRGNGNYVEFLHLDGPVSLRNLYVEFINPDTYWNEVVLDYKTPDREKISRPPFLIDTVWTPDHRRPVLVGFIPHWVDDHYILALQLVNNDDTEYEIMPRFDENLRSLRQEQVDNLNTYLSFPLYIWRMAYTGETVELEKEYPYYKKDRLKGHVGRIDADTLVGRRINEIVALFKKYVKDGLPSDAPPQLLSLP